MVSVIFDIEGSLDSRSLLALWDEYRRREVAEKSGAPSSQFGSVGSEGY